MGNYIDKLSSKYLISDYEGERSFTNPFGTPKYRLMPELDPRSPTLEIERTPFYLPKYGEDTPVADRNPDDTPKWKEIKKEKSEVQIDTQKSDVDEIDSIKDDDISPIGRPKNEVLQITKRHLFVSPAKEDIPSSPEPLDNIVVNSKEVAGLSPELRPKEDVPQIIKRHLFASPVYKMSPNSPQSKERTPLGRVSSNEAAQRRIWKAPMDERKRLYGENTPPAVQLPPFSSPRSAPPASRLRLA